MKYGFMNKQTLLKNKIKTVLLSRECFRRERLSFQGSRILFSKEKLLFLSLKTYRFLQCVILLSCYTDAHCLLIMFIRSLAIALYLYNYYYYYDATINNTNRMEQRYNIPYTTSPGLPLFFNVSFLLLSFQPPSLLFSLPHSHSRSLTPSLFLSLPPPISL